MCSILLVFRVCPVLIVLVISLGSYSISLSYILVLFVAL